MEQPYAGRAIISDTYDTFTITIPSKKYWFAVVFLTVWLTGWTFGETQVFNQLIHGTPPKDGGFIFMVVWFIGWTIGGLAAFRVFIWQLMGAEILTFTNGQLTVDNKWLLFDGVKTYDLREVKNFRVESRTAIEELSGRRQRRAVMENGIILFDYGMKTAHIGMGIDEPEAAFLVKRLKERRFVL